jgi:hypothetical protein
MVTILPNVSESRGISASYPVVRSLTLLAAPTEKRQWFATSTKITQG